MTQAQLVGTETLRLGLVAPTRDAALGADVAIPFHARGVVLFAHGSGSSRFSGRNRHVAGVLQQAGFATVLLDLLTQEEEAIDAVSHAIRFDIPLLAERLADVTDWCRSFDELHGLRAAYFGASTGATAALVAAAKRPQLISAVVSRGGRPDLAGDHLARVFAPTLLIVGSLDTRVLPLNVEARKRLGGPSDLQVVAGASHLFEEPGTLDHAADLAASWLARFV